MLVRLPACLAVLLDVKSDVLLAASLPAPCAASIALQTFCIAHHSNMPPMTVWPQQG